MYVLLIIDDSPNWESGNQDSQVKITLLRPKDEILLLPLSSGSFQLGHHRIVTYGTHKYSFVPHSHAILALFVLLEFCPFI